jgi:hypothetical protein
MSFPFDESRLDQCKRLPENRWIDWGRFSNDEEADAKLINDRPRNTKTAKKFEVGIRVPDPQVNGCGTQTLPINRKR